MRPWGRLREGGCEGAIALVSGWAARWDCIVGDGPGASGGTAWRSGREAIRELLQALRVDWGSGDGRGWTAGRSGADTGATGG